MFPTGLVLGAKAGPKGWRFEHLIQEGLEEAGYDVVRPRAGQPQDEGDIIGVSGWTIQCKDHKTLSLGSWIDQTKQQKIHGKTPWYALIIKRKRTTDFKKQFVLMEVEQWLAIVAALSD